MGVGWREVTCPAGAGAFSTLFSRLPAVTSSQRDRAQVQVLQKIRKESSFSARILIADKV
jgi:hypothetical protein